MKIVKIACSAGRTGFYFDDQRAIKAGAKNDGMAYIGEPKTEGFTSIRQAGESISVMIFLEGGQVAYGDCAAVQYSGAGGRDPLFLAEDFIPIIEEHVVPHFIGKDLSEFRPLSDELEAIEVNGKKLHTAIRYGVSQALLDAVAKANSKMMCEVVADEWDIKVSEAPIPIFTQSGDDRYTNADKMIIKQAPVLPHALINSVDEKLGKDGAKLIEYIEWLRDRIQKLRSDDSYNPTIHIDVYGTIGMAFGETDVAAQADYIAKLEEAAKPFQLYVEGPMDVENREGTMEALRDLTTLLDERNINVKLVADEWCNTIEDIKYFVDNGAGHIIQVKTPDLGSVANSIDAVLYCKENGVGAYQGGTCNETDRSAQVCAQIAMASQPDQLLAKPGMGVDEGFMIAFNEMARIVAIRKAR